MAEKKQHIMVAPCGINCAVCYRHLKKKKPCPGCRGQDDSKPEHCRKCAIKDCAVKQDHDFCFQCPSFPCPRIKRLDKRYRERYHVSLIDNAIALNQIGMAQYIREERARWTCAACGGVICMHDRVCSECGKEA